MPNNAISSKISKIMNNWSSYLEHFDPITTNIISNHDGILIILHDLKYIKLLIEAWSI